MAMNKAERAALEQAQTTAHRTITEMLAWRRTAEPQRDLPVPTSGSETRGWDINAYKLGHVGQAAELSAAVYKVASSSAFHRHGWEPGTSGRQRGVALYSTEVLALRALRAQLESDTAAKLAKIDVRIAQLGG